MESLPAVRPRAAVEFVTSWRVFNDNVMVIIENALERMDPVDRIRIEGIPTLQAQDDVRRFLQEWARGYSIVFEIAELHGVVIAARVK